MSNFTAAFSSPSAYEHKITRVMSILISTLIIDNLLYAFLFGGAFSRQLDSLWGILFFVIIAVVSYAAGLYLLFRFITPIYRKIKMHSSYFNWIYKTLSVAQYSTGVILGVITFQMLSSSHYYAGLLVTDIAISCTVSAIIMAILGHRFISWYMYSRKEVTVLLYGLTFVVTAIGIGIIVTVDGSFLLSQAPTALIKGSQPLSKVNSSSYISVAPSALILYQITYTPFRLAFLLYWIATALLLRNYSIKFGKVRFWTIVSLPLISFLVGSILVNPDYKHGLLYDALLTLSALSAGGILFGITFLTTARTIRHTGSTEQNSTLSYYLTISAYGTVLIVVSVTSPVIFMPYPPFAATAWSFVGLSSYLYSLGFYFSAISIAQDTKLRKSIRELAIKESELFDSIGTAQMEQEIQKKVLKIAKEQEKTLEEQTGIEIHIWQQQKIEQESIQDYVAEVLAEVKKSRDEKNE